MRGTKYPLLQLRVPAGERDVREHAQLVIHDREPPAVREGVSAEDLIRHRKHRLAGLQAVGLLELHVMRSIERRRVGHTRIALGLEARGERELDRGPVESAHRHGYLTSMSTVTVVP